jgi:endonuclease YncB( thermonuclease family)
MPYRLIKGEFHIHTASNPKQGPEPDGDTLKFKPDSPQLVELLTRSGHSPAFNKAKMINLRLEGIDALELHYEDTFQNMEWAEEARDFLLARMGFGNIEFFQDPRHALKIEKVQNHPVRGYIVSYSLDSYGRVIAFAFAGDTDLPDGFNYFLKAGDVDKSVNGQLLKEGYVYPTFYTTLPRDLTNHMREIAKTAREASLGLWAVEHVNTSKASSVRNLEEAELLVMWPKLFRRLASYFNAGNEGLAQLDTWLRADMINRDDSIQLPNGELGNMHDLIQVEGNKLKLNFIPEDLVILPDPISSVPIKSVETSSKVLKGDVRLVVAMVNPAGTDVAKEYVMVANTTPGEIILEGWQLRDKGTDKQMLKGSLGPQEVKRISLEAHFTLNNTGDTISIFDKQAQLVDEVSYTKSQAEKQGHLVVF